MVICGQKEQPTLGWIALCRRTRQVIGLHRRPQRRQWPGFAPTNPPKLSFLLFLQRLLGGVSIGLRRRNAAPWARKRVKPPTSSVGTTPCANAWLALCAKLCLFPSPTISTLALKLFIHDYNLQCLSSMCNHHRCEVLCTERRSETYFHSKILVAFVKRKMFGV